MKIFSRPNFCFQPLEISCLHYDRSSLPFLKFFSTSKIAQICSAPPYSHQLFSSLFVILMVRQLILLRWAKRFFILDWYGTNCTYAQIHKMLRVMSLMTEICPIYNYFLFLFDLKLTYVTFYSCILLAANSHEGLCNIADLLPIYSDLTKSIIHPHLAHLGMLMGGTLCSELGVTDYHRVASSTNYT